MNEVLVIDALLAMFFAFAIVALFCWIEQEIQESDWWD
jgi:4-amino-4-deoxy-L-arabinose transferase-like glycosyltransferase